MQQQPLFLTLEEVLNLHEESIARYGGAPEIRDMGLLESALAAPESTFGGVFLHPDLPSMAAAYLFHCVMNHPFVDGNKRTGAAVARVFLLLNSVSFDPPNKEYEELVLGVASGLINKQQATEFFLRYAK